MPIKSIIDRGIVECLPTSIRSDKILTAVDLQRNMLNSIVEQIDHSFFTNDNLVFNTTHLNVVIGPNRPLDEFANYICSNNKIDSTNICLTGGAALNVLLNEILIMKVGLKDNLFIPPNPDDGGLSLGQLFLLNQEKNQQDITFNGLPILDEEKFDFFLKKNKNKKVNYKELAEYIISGKIVGIIENDSEVGPRALGNRSIVCDPRFLSMKDTLNSKVKFREWFRPFAGSILKEHANEWFDMAGMDESPYMMYAVNVQADKTNKIPNITHVDDTCRIQTVTPEQNKHYYELISEFNKITGVPILFNTSFNLGGDALVETINDAIDALVRSDMKYLYLPEIGKLVTKK